jgi:hypothetical protein
MSRHMYECGAEESTLSDDQPSMLNEDERRGGEEENENSDLGFGARASGPSKTPACTDPPLKVTPLVARAYLLSSIRQ